MTTKLCAALSVAIVLATLAGCAIPDRATTQIAEHAKMRECIVKNGKVYDLAGNLMTGCVARFDGAMMTMNDRQLVPMKENMRMTNGEICLVDGTCIMKDGSRRKLHEGEVLTREGEFMRIKDKTR